MEQYSPNMDTNKEKRLQLPPIKSTKGYFGLSNKRRKVVSFKNKDEDLHEESDLLSRFYPSMKLNPRKRETNPEMLLPPLRNPEEVKLQMPGIKKKTSDLPISSLKVLSLATRHCKDRTTMQVNMDQASITKPYFRRQNSDKKPYCQVYSTSISPIVLKLYCIK